MKAVFRRLLRNRRRTILALAAVIIPVFLLVLVLGLIGGMERDMFLNTIRFDTGHLQIRRMGSAYATVKASRKQGLLFPVRCVVSAAQRSTPTEEGFARF